MACWSHMLTHLALYQGPVARGRPRALQTSGLLSAFCRAMPLHTWYLQDRRPEELRVTAIMLHL